MLSRQWNQQIDHDVNGNTAALVLPLWFRHILRQTLVLISPCFFHSIASVLILVEGYL